MITRTAPITPASTDSVRLGFWYHIGTVALMCWYLALAAVAFCFGFKIHEEDLG